MKNLSLIIAVAIILSFVGCGKKMEQNDTIVVSNGEIAPKFVVGNQLQNDTFKDQFDKTHIIESTTRKIIFVCTKPAGHLIREVLDKKGGDFLRSKNIQLIVDINKMPSIIYSMFALPDLKKSTYPILIIKDKDISAQYKNEKYQDNIMIINIDNGMITNAVFVSKTADLLNELNK